MGLRRPGRHPYFFAGAEEIRRAGPGPLAEREDYSSCRSMAVFPRRATAAALPQRARKVVLATNIAETMLTIDGVRTVIDCGLARFASVDPRRGLDRLELGRTLRPPGRRRAGRADRPGALPETLVGTGEHRGLPASDPPEIQRVDRGTALVLHAWGQADPRRFGWYDPPTESRPAPRLRSCSPGWGLPGCVGQPAHRQATVRLARSSAPGLFR